MKFSENNFLYAIKQIVTGSDSTQNEYSGSGVNAVTGTESAADGGIKVDLAISPNQLTLGAHTSVSVVNGIQSLVTTNGANFQVGQFSIPVPRDYDEATDYMVIRGFASLANADSGIGITGTPSVFTPGGTATTLPVQTATAPFPQITAAGTYGTIALSQTSQVFEINLSGMGLTRDNALGVNLNYTGTTTGNANIAWLETTYASTIVSYNDTDQTGVDGKLGEYGNPLR